ncbi:hypothetical protein LENED_005750 [Lentinula edodes]|uniref:Uncharacterized protein n=1 Tax=Lentinula edodes TaxID=5353 RepID=A0A1Q3E9U3_LENED|nr:hypothetical protein LENED_005750 [Lentinula edodes]
MSLVSSSKSEPSVIGSEKCQMVEIIQYSCELERSQTEGPVVRCFPWSRLFRICPGLPAVEMTKFLNVDEGGVVELPADINPPSGKPWNRVVRHDSSVDS